MIRLLALVLCLLAGSVAAELAYLRDPVATRSSAGGAAERVVAVAAPPAADRSVQSEQWLAVVLARPLFDPSRRARSGSAEVAMQRLAGIVTSATDAVAIFQATDSAKPVSVRHGDRIGGWEVARVTRDAVTLHKAGATIVLTPQFRNSTTGAAAREAAKPAPTRWEQAAASGILRARWSNPQLQP